MKPVSIVGDRSLRSGLHSTVKSKIVMCKLRIYLPVSAVSVAPAFLQPMFSRPSKRVFEAAGKLTERFVCPCIPFLIHNLKARQISLSRGPLYFSQLDGLCALFPVILDFTDERLFYRLNFAVHFLWRPQVAVHGEQVVVHRDAEAAFVFL